MPLERADEGLWRRLVIDTRTTRTEAARTRSEDHQKVVAAPRIACSMSRRGSCYHNAAMERWFSTLRSELGGRFETHTSAKDQLFDYIEVFYNEQRIHSAIGYASPAEFERAASLKVVA